MKSAEILRLTPFAFSSVFTYDNWKPVAEWSGAGDFVAWNLYGAGADEILVRFQQTPEGYLHYHLDAMGNVQFLLSDHPDPGLEKYTYDVFGKPRIVGWNGVVRPISNHGNRFLFTGREYLYTFGLYDYRHRIYHPGLGRFIQTDPLGLQIEGTKLSAQQTALYALGGTASEKFSSSELNLYRYCHNNPVNNGDPFGLLEILYQGYPAKGPGGLAKVQEAINVMRTTPQGRMLLDSPGIMKILPTGKDESGVFHKLGVEGYKGDFRLYLDPTHPTFYDEKTYRNIYKGNFSEKAPETAEGRASVIDHELGHGVLGLDDEDKGGTNVHDNENVFRSQLKPPMDPRPSYGGVKVKIEKDKDRKK